MPVVSISMPDQLIQRLDAVADEHEYAGRSDVVRESARTLLEEFENESFVGRDLAGVVTVCYDFGARSVERRLAALRHDHEARVTATDHCHVADSCVDLFVLEGTLDDVSTFVGRVRSIEAVQAVEYSLLPLDEIDRLRSA